MKGMCVVSSTLHLKVKFHIVADRVMVIESVFAVSRMCFLTLLEKLELFEKITMSRK